MSLVLLMTVWSPMYLFNIALAKFLVKWWGHDLHNSKELCEFHQFQLLSWGRLFKLLPSATSKVRRWHKRREQKTIVGTISWQDWEGELSALLYNAAR